MDFIFDSIRSAVSLILALDKDVYQAVLTSLYTSLASVLLTSAIGIPSGTLLFFAESPLKRVIVITLNTLMALPTVVIGLIFYGLLSRQGPLGSLGLLFTPSAVIIGQTVLALPIVTNYTLGSLKGADKRIFPTAMTLGASRLQSYMKILSETRFGVAAAVIAGFGRVIAEVGVAMMLGGNIKGYTRTMTTAIALETSKGEFAFGLALGIILMVVALVVNIFLNVLQEK